MTAPVASGWSLGRVGLEPTGKRRLFTAHTQSGRSDLRTGCSKAGSLSGGANHRELAPMQVRSDRRCHSLFSAKVGVRSDVGTPQKYGLCPLFFPERLARVRG